MVSNDVTLDTWSFLKIIMGMSYNFCYKSFYPIYVEWNFPLLSNGPVHFCFKGFWVLVLILFKFW